MKKDNILHTNSYVFAIRAVRLSRYLNKEKKEYILIPNFQKENHA